jgi:heme A synthase
LNARFAKFCWGVLGYNVLVVLWGAYVRATGSGAGCGSHWPLCNGEMVPRGASLETLIELSHRVTSGLALLAVVAMLIGAWRLYPAAHRVRRGALAAMVLMLGEAAVGAGLVLFELVAENESMARALFMGVHLMNTFLLMAALVLTAYWAGGGAAVQWSGRSLPLGERWALGVAIAGALLIGVSGAVCALGDTLFPAGSLEEALRQDWSATSHLLIRLRLLHPLIAVVAGVFMLFLGRSVARRETLPLGRSLANALSLVVLAQLTIGTLNVALLAPIWMQLTHLLMADVVWLNLVLLAAVRLRVVAAESGAGLFGPARARRSPAPAR